MLGWQPKAVPGNGQTAAPGGQTNITIRVFGKDR